MTDVSSPHLHRVEAALHKTDPTRPDIQHVVRARFAVLGLVSFALATFVCGFSVVSHPTTTIETVRFGSAADQLLLICRVAAMLLGCAVSVSLIRALIGVLLDCRVGIQRRPRNPSSPIGRLVRVAFQGVLVTAIAASPALAVPTTSPTTRSENPAKTDTAPVSISVDASGQRWPVFAAARPPLTGVARPPTPGSKLPVLGPPFVQSTPSTESPTTNTYLPTNSAPIPTAHTTKQVPSTGAGIGPQTAPPTSPTGLEDTGTASVTRIGTNTATGNTSFKPTTPSLPGTWTVKPGESFWSIAEQLARASSSAGSATTVGAIWSLLLEANRSNLVVPDLPDLLYPGQELIVPPTIAQLPHP